jgi:hypothetical protein
MAGRSDADAARRLWIEMPEKLNGQVTFFV